VRFFGGWDYPAELCESPELAAAGYRGGVPMGGALSEAPDAAGAPRFVVSALQDPGTPSVPGTPLQRVQVVKGWVKDGQAHEKVYDVAGGDNGARVDTKTCQRSGEGSGSLCAVWQDPEFDASLEAFYYARILEIPTPRWSTYDAKAMGVRAPEPTTLQERAITSAIWVQAHGAAAVGNANGQ